MRFSVVIPCYNEAKSLPALVARCERVLAAEPACEFILVDNGSSDESCDVLAKELVSQTRIRSIRVPVNLGYGHGILEGLKICTGDVLGWTHADLQTDPMDVVQGFELFKHAKSEPLFVKGKRRGRPLPDRAFTAAMSVFETLLLGRVMRDINAQPTLFSRALYERWHDAPEDFALDLYAYMDAQLAGARVCRFPVLFVPRQHGVSHWNINWKSKMKFIGRTIGFSFRLRRIISLTKGNGVG